MQPIRLTLAAIALIGGTAFTDPAQHFTIAFPEGWTAPVIDPDGNAEARGPESGPTSWCRANSNPLATLVGFSQESLNTQYASPLSAETWGEVLSVDAAKMQMSESVAGIVDGHVVHMTTLTFTPDVFGVEVKGRFASHILSGRMVNAACFTVSPAYETQKPAFEASVSSLKPI